MGFQHMEPERLRTFARKASTNLRVLTATQVTRVRECTDGTTDQAFADEFGVNAHTVFCARIGHTYKDHPSAPRRVYAKRGLS